MASTLPSMLPKMFTESQTGNQQLDNATHSPTQNEALLTLTHTHTYGHIRTFPTPSLQLINDTARLPHVLLLSAIHLPKRNVTYYYDSNRCCCCCSCCCLILLVKPDFFVNVFPVFLIMPVLFCLPFFFFLFLSTFCCHFSFVTLHATSVNNNNSKYHILDHKTK